MIWGYFNVDDWQKFMMGEDWQWLMNDAGKDFLWNEKMTP
jgi:hypothetical protein